MGTKRKANQLDGPVKHANWCKAIQQLPRDEIANLLGEIANQANIKTADIKRARTALPSFSGEKWSALAKKNWPC